MMVITNAHALPLYDHNRQFAAVIVTVTFVVVSISVIVIIAFLAVTSYACL